MSLEHTKHPGWLARILLVIAGIVAGVGLMVLLLALFPNLVRDPLNDQDIYGRDSAGNTLNVEFRLSDGDMFTFFPTSIRPPDPDYPLESYTITWDEDGFRVPKVTADHYPIAAFGDSFTEGPVVPQPWPDVLAESLGVPVGNYGYRGYGPEETAKAVEEFAGTEPRSWLIYAFFAGNDLNDINRAKKLEDRGPLLRLPFLLRQASESLIEPTPFPPDYYFDYPMAIIIGDKFYDFVPFDEFIWGQVAPQEGFEASLNYEITSQSLDRMAASVPEDTCLAFVFLPTKEQIYYRYIHEGYRRWLRDRAQHWTLNDARQLILQPAPITEEQEADIMAHFYDQRDAIAKLVASKPRWRFLDLLPIFEEQATTGDLLFYQYDTHFNQLGHRLAGEQIAEFLRSQPDCPV